MTTARTEDALIALAADVAGDVLELASVRGYQRFEHGREETVHPYTNLKQPHGEPGEPGAKPAGWIPEPKWLEGQKEWEAAGEAAWQKAGAAEAAQDAAQARTPSGGLLEETPKTGAAAIHPTLGDHLFQEPGGTLSGHERNAHARPSEQLFGAMQAAQPQPLSRQEYTAHVAEVEDKVARAIDAGQATDKKFTINGTGEHWLPERAAQHNAIVDHFLNDAADRQVPSEGKAILSGGLPGAGKTTVLRREIQGQWLVVNPDDVKKEMAARGMVPEVSGLSPMEASPLIHEESSHIANLLADAALAQKLNTVFDLTMRHTDSTRERLAQLRQAGYTDLGGVFVRIPISTSLERAKSRHQIGFEKYRMGEGFGGRLVPSALIRATDLGGGRTSPEDTFTKLKNQFTWTQVWDNSGDQPKRVDIKQPEPSAAQQSLQRLQQGGTPSPYTGSTEAQARAREKGTLA